MLRTRTLLEMTQPDEDKSSGEGWHCPVRMESGIYGKPSSEFVENFAGNGHSATFLLI